MLFPEHAHGTSKGSIKQQVQKRGCFCSHLTAGGIALSHFSLQKVSITYALLIFCTREITT